jgi:lipopolysaccharide transport system permease protein
MSEQGLDFIGARQSAISHPLTSTVTATTDQSPTSSLPVTIIEPSRGWARLNLRDLWEYRELLYFLTWRDIKVRYKQTAIGIAWAILQPLITMIILMVIFGHFAQIPSDGLPYAIFAFAALLPWTYFAGALNRVVNSVVADAHLVSKVYFPRLILPLVGTISGLIDFAISFLSLLATMYWFQVIPTWRVVALPLFLLLALLAALAVGLWLAALHVRYRDVVFTIPFLIQIWMFASPVVYPVSLVPERWRAIYSLNPMVGVIEGFRWALFGNKSPEFSLMAVSTAFILLLLIGGLVFFKHIERTFADVV